MSWRLRGLLASSSVLALAGVAEAQLTHRYSFNETGGSGTAVADSVGTANGTIVNVGANDATVGGGQVTMAGGAKDASDYVAFPSGLVTGNAAFSIETWATPVAIQNWSRVFSVNGGPNQSTSGAGEETGTEWHLPWTRGTGDNTQQYEAVGRWQSPTNNPLALNQEHHIVATWDGTAARWYLDGRLATIVRTNNVTPATQADTAFWLGRSAFPDNTATANYNEFRTYSTALSKNQIAANRAAGPNVATVTLPAATAGPAVGVWEFRFHDAGGNTQGPQVSNGESLPDGGLFNSSSFAPPEHLTNAGHNIAGTPTYATYDPVAEGIAGRPGADGFAMNSTGGYPWFGDTDSGLQRVTQTNATFSAWARVKRTADGDDFESILSRPNRWRVGVDTDGTIAARFGDTATSVSFDTNIPFTIGQWRDVGFSYDPITSLVTLYVDGVPAGTLTSTAFDAGDVFHIADGPGGGESFLGLVDRALFWDETVNAATFAALTVPEPGALGMAAAGGGLLLLRRRRQRDAGRA